MSYGASLDILTDVCKIDSGIIMKEGNGGGSELKNIRKFLWVEGELNICSRKPSSPFRP